MILYVPDFFGFTGNEDNFSIVYQNWLLPMANAKPTAHIGHVDNQGKFHVDFKSPVSDVSLNLKLYKAIGTTTVQSMSCTFATAKAICSALGIGTEKNSESAFSLIVQRNDIYELLTLLFPYRCVSLDGGAFETDEDAVGDLIVYLSNKNNDKSFLQNVSSYFPLYVNATNAQIYTLTPYDRIQTHPNGTQVVLFGDVPESAITERNAFLASLCNTCGALLFYTAINNSNNEGLFLQSAFMFKRACLFAENQDEYAMSAVNFDELYDVTKGLGCYEQICNMRKAMQNIPPHLQKNTDISTLNQAPASIPTHSTSTVPGSVSDIETWNKYLHVLTTSEVSAYRIVQQINTVSAIKNSITPAKVKAFKEKTGDWETSPEKLFAENKNNYFAWRMNYQQAKYSIQITDTKKEYCDATISKLTKQKNEIEAVITKLYSYNILPQKYRSLTAVATIYEYFANGRVSNLKEALNMYEHELRMNLIIDGVNNVVQAINDMHNSMIQNQQVLFNAIQETNNSIQHMNQQIGILADNYAKNTSRTRALLEESVSQNKVLIDNSNSIKDSLMWIEMNDYYFSKM